MKQKKILIVDDSEFDRQMLAKALAKRGGFQIVQVRTGEECLDLIDGREKIDLILMDIMMPGSFGTHVLMKIREKFNPIDLPIIMVTSKGDAIDVICSLQSGANDYIIKPVNFDVAISRILTHLKLADMSYEMSLLKELAALDAMIATYNHEINTPLAIALNCLDKDNQVKDQESGRKLNEALLRITDIVKRIGEVTQKKNVEYQQYSQGSKMVKLS